MLRTTLNSRSLFHSQSIKYQQEKTNNVEKTPDDNENFKDYKSEHGINQSKQSFLQRLQSKPKPVKNTPFIKNLFRGNYLYEYLKFPEYEHNYLLETLNKNYVEPVKSYFQKTSYNKVINERGNFTPDALHNFRNLNLYSKSIPKEYDGVELDSTSIARVLEETGIYPGLGISLIYNNELAAKSILTYGNSEQKEKYLKRIARGELKAGFCYSEFDNGIDASRFNLIAKAEGKDSGKDKQTFLLNGKKSWVTLLSGDDIEHEDVVLIAICKTLEFNETIDEETKSLNAFIVDKNTPGLVINKQLSNKNGLNLYEIDFKDVRVCTENLLGSLGSGFDISNKIIENSRFLIGSLCVGMLKNMLKETIDFAISSRRFGKSLSEYPQIKNKIAEIETKLYTMESMTYLTAGIIDSYETPDVSCESALTKIYCTEALRTSVNDCLDIMAMGAYTRLDEVKQKYLLDLNYLTNALSTNDVLRLYVSTTGLVLAAAEFGEELTKVRNPFKYPGFILRQILINHKLVRSAQKKVPEYFYLWEHVHPSLNVPAGVLEQSAVKFMMAAKSSIINHGRDVIESQTSLVNLAEICMHLYALNSVIARASRAYSIGLPNSQHDVALAFIQSEVSGKVINELHSDIIKARGGLGVENMRANIADRVFKFKDHAASHSISRNY